MKLFTAIIAFILGFGMWLGLIYIFNYALVAEDGLMYTLIPATFMPTYRLLNMIWTAMPFIGGLVLLIKSINKERLFG